MSEILCPRCNAPNRATAKFCFECGAALPSASTAAPDSTGKSINIDLGFGTAASGAVGSDAATAAPPARQGGDEHSADDPTTIPAEFETGKVLYNRYRLGRELGRGGFGAVWEAWDVNLNRRCAIKENLDASPEAARQFAREASVLANLSHPNLPRVTDHFTIPGQGQYLVMDYVEGEDLLSLAQREKRLPAAQALFWVLQVAGALIYLHSRQPAVLHRDIKPSNIRITPNGQAMLVDFGLVKFLDPLMKTTMGARAVTPGYAPPEQYGQGRTDARSDIYALGATLYKILTGLEPVESVMRISGERQPPAYQVNPNVSPQLSQVIEKSMALDPADRFQSAMEFRAALEAARLSLNPGAVVARGAPPLQSHAVSTPANASVPQGSVQRPPSGPRPAAQPGTVQRPISGPRPAPAAPGGQKTFPWVWFGVGVAVFLLVVCLAGGGVLALFSGGTPTPTAVVQAATDTPRSGPGETPVSESPTPEVRPPVGVETPPPPVITEPPTPDPAFRSPDPSRFVFSEGSDPDTLDPALSYLTASVQVIQNLYDTLVFYRREDPNTFIPQLAVEVPSRENGGISPDGRMYTFKIRSGVRFHDGSILTPEDVAYTFQRNILQGGTGSPMLLLTEPILGIGVYDVAQEVGEGLTDNRTALKAADPARREAVCRRIQEAIRADNAAGTVTFELAQPWAPFLPTLANAWGGIRSKAWTIANGGWNGDCAVWQDYYAPTIEALNKTPLGSGAMGTGPYKLESWKPGQELTLVANEDYWRTDPAWPGGPSGPPAIKSVVYRYHARFADRLALIQSGEADAVTYESNADWPALESLTGRICRMTDADCSPGPNPDAPLESIRGFPTAGRNFDIFFNWNIGASGGNELIGSGRLDGNGIPPDFFTNVHVRRGFAYCFNYNTYLVDVLQGEGVRSINVMLPGMIGYSASTPYYSHDLKRCEEAFRQAEFNGVKVWEKGFRIKLPVVQGVVPSRRIAEIFKAELAAVNPKFIIDVVEVSSEEYGNLSWNRKLPLFYASWLEDIHDPHNWVVPYTVTHYSVTAGQPADLKAEFKSIVNRAVAETDPERRAAVYAEFNTLFYEQAPTILMYQTMGRQYQLRWVRGWYNNPVLPGLYFYVLSKD